jgi:hypothetical protein
MELLFHGRLWKHDQRQGKIDDEKAYQKSGDRFTCQIYAGATVTTHWPEEGVDLEERECRRALSTGAYHRRNRNSGLRPRG